MTKYEAVIGLEVHAELMTNSKMFSGCPVVDSVEAEPNTAVCALSLGMPGTLPVINKRAVEYATRVALALNCQINHKNVFARKNYFYPDLPKSYQISQYEEPLAVNGWLDITLKSGETRRIRVRRVHMEEDTGKLTHMSDGGSLVDYNRAGVPLLEIVSEPDIHTAEEARAYAVKMRQILRYLGVNSGDMEKGVLRVEPNISIRPVGSKTLGTRTELKNLNSFRALTGGTEYEIKRQIMVVRSGKRVVQETRGWNESKRITFSQRGKEDAHDYRYLPDPDLPPLNLTDAFIEDVRASLPELPDAIFARLTTDLGVPSADALQLTEERAIAAWFDAAVAAGGDPRNVAKWMTNELFRLMNEHKQDITEIQVTPAGLNKLIALVSKKTINNNTAKEVLAEMFTTGKQADAIVKDKGLAQISDEAAIADVVEQIFAENPQNVRAYLAGQTKLRGWFVGQVMRAMRGKANPRVVNKLLDAQFEAVDQE